MIIKTVQHCKHEDIDGICITIGQVDNIRQSQHIGFLYRSSENLIKFLHLAGHNVLLSDSPPECEYVWLDIPFFNKHNIEHFQMFLDDIYEKNHENGIPYGVSIDGIDINYDGSLLKNYPYEGLTCASFVLRALHAQGYTIIDISNWQLRIEDEKWQEFIFYVMKERWHVSEEHLAHQKKLKGAPRFRPEEVATATVTVKDHPLSSKEVEAPSKKLVEELSNQYKLCSQL